MKSKKLVAIVAAAAVCVSFLGTTEFSRSNTVKADTQTVQASSSNNITRLGGTDRYDTSVKISQYGWKQADTVFIAGAERDTDFADAIAGTPLAHSYDAPILLTRAAALPSNISAEIERLSPKNVYILGGTGVVSSNIENGLKAKGYTVIRIAGKDRYETAIEIAKRIWAKNPSTSGKLGSDTGAIITTGQQFQYALSIAGSTDAPILFSDGDTINPKVANLIAGNKNIQSVEVVGGDKVVHLGDYYKNNPSLFLIDNYNSVSELEKGTKLEGVYGIAVASDTIFPDALSGSALAAKLGYVLVLSNGTDFPYTIEPILNHLSSAVLLGGTGVISDNLPGKISAIFNKDFSANPSGLKDSDVIPFTDENLKKDVEKYVGKADITLADAKKIREIRLIQNNGGYQINSLADLKYFPELSGIQIVGGNLPSDISVLNSLHDFDGLYLKDCNFDQSTLDTLSKKINIYK